MNHRMVKIASQSGDELPRVILGNSITLSPGTITIDIDDREVLVHCISEEGAQDMESGELLRRIEALGISHDLCSGVPAILSTMVLAVARAVKGPSMLTGC